MYYLDRICAERSVCLFAIMSDKMGLFICESLLFKRSKVFREQMVYLYSFFYFLYLLLDHNQSRDWWWRRRRATSGLWFFYNNNYTPSKTIDRRVWLTLRGCLGRVRIYVYINVGTNKKKEKNFSSRGHPRGRLRCVVLARSYKYIRSSVTCIVHVYSFIVIDMEKKKKGGSVLETLWCSCLPPSHFLYIYSVHRRTDHVNRFLFYIIIYYKYVWNLLPESGSCATSCICIVYCYSTITRKRKRADFDLQLFRCRHTVACVGVLRC